MNLSGYSNTTLHTSLYSSSKLVSNLHFLFFFSIMKDTLPLGIKFGFLFSIISFSEGSLVIKQNTTFTVSVFSSVQEHKSEEFSNNHTSPLSSISSLIAVFSYYVILSCFLSIFYYHTLHSTKSFFSRSIINCCITAIRQFCVS